MGEFFFTNATPDITVLVGTERIPLDNAAGDSEFTTPDELKTYILTAEPILQAELITTPQTVTNNVVTKVQLNSTDVFGTLNGWDPVTFLYTPPVPGVYQVSGSVYALGTTVTEVEATISKNGTVGSGGTVVVDGVASGMVATAQFGVTTPVGYVRMNGVNDTLELDALMTGTGTLQCAAVRNATSMSVQWVRP